MDIRSEYITEQLHCSEHRRLLWRAKLFARQPQDAFQTVCRPNGKPSIIFGLKSQNEVSWPQSTLIAAISAIAIAASLIGFYLFRQNRQKTKDIPKSATFAGATLTESDEEKILKTIQSSGGVLNQTAIAEQCRFSKAKTSQLLTALEQKGVIKRFKKGRDKIVMLTEKHNGENK